MRKILLTLCLIAVAILAKAAKANPRPFVVTQPDGTQVTLIMRGDEHFSWISTLDGTIVTQVNKGYYVAKIDENGNIIASEILAHDVEKRSVAEQKLAKAQAKDLSLELQKAVFIKQEEHLLSEKLHLLISHI